MAVGGTKGERVIDALAAGNMGRALLIECKRRNIHQVDAAEGFGLAKQTCSEWVNGERKPSANHARKLADFLHVPIASVREVIDMPRQERIDVLEAEVAKLADAVEVLSNTLRGYAEQLGVDDC